MKTTLIKSLAVIATTGILLVSACKKEESATPENPANSTNTGTSALGSFFAANIQAATQTFTINANSSQTIYGAKGTRLSFQPNIFKTPSGSLATGNITIELIEIQSKADMILLNKTTSSNGNLLESGGEISLKAFQNGNQLTLSSGVSNQSIFVNLPSNNPGNNNMILFAGQPTATGDVNWALTGLNGPNNNVIPDSINGYFFIMGNDSIATNDSLGWINCDVFMSNANNSHININLPSGMGFDGSKNGNTRAFTFFNNRYSVAGLEWNGSTSNFGTSSYTTGFPINEPVKIVVISNVNGQYYYSITPTTISSNLSLNVSMNPTSLAALKNDINNL